MTDSSDSDIDNNIQNSVPEKKTRGRKKKIIDPDSIKIIPEDVVKKKRGRKKKWEVETTSKLLDNNEIIFSENIKTNLNTEIISENYERQDISFGNLNIKVHTNKDLINTENIISTLKKNEKCKINLTKSDFEDFELESNNRKKIEIKKIKVMKYHKDTFDSGNDILLSHNRCYNCHHKFQNKPFFLPIDYCPKTSRYKVCGNYCSPNCVKTYANNHKVYYTKSYLVGQMYKKLFGYDYVIKPAPPIEILKEYGGTLSINEFRQNFYNDDKYSLKNINCKLILEEVVIH